MILNGSTEHGKKFSSIFLDAIAVSVVSAYSSEQRIKLPYISLPSKGERLTVLSAGVLVDTYLEEVRTSFSGRIFL